MERASEPVAAEAEGATERASEPVAAEVDWATEAELEIWALTHWATRKC